MPHHRLSVAMNVTLAHAQKLREFVSRRELRRLTTPEHLVSLLDQNRGVLDTEVHLFLLDYARCIEEAFAFHNGASPPVREALELIRRIFLQNAFSSGNASAVMALSANGADWSIAGHNEAALRKQLEDRANVAEFLNKLERVHEVNLEPVRRALGIHK